MSSWAPAGGDEKLLGPDRSSVAEGEEDDCAGALALFGPDPQADVDTRLRHRFGELAPGERLLVAEQARLALDQGPATRSRRIPDSSRSPRRRPQGRSTDPGCPSRWWPRDWSTARLAPTPGSVRSRRRCRVAPVDLSLDARIAGAGEREATWRLARLERHRRRTARRGRVGRLRAHRAGRPSRGDRRDDAHRQPSGPRDSYPRQAAPQVDPRLRPAGACSPPSHQQRRFERGRAVNGAGSGTGGATRGRPAG
jgi:hypothetical protein